jgi:hypothetical protein
VLILAYFASLLPPPLIPILSQRCQH